MHYTKTTNFLKCGTLGDTMKKPPKIVLDTNVLVAGLRSRQGASFQLLSRLRFGQFELHLTVPLAMEYEDVLHHPGLLSLPVAAIDAVLDMVCAVASKQEVHFLWRPQLRDRNLSMTMRHLGTLI